MKVRPYGTHYYYYTTTPSLVKTPEVGRKYKCLKQSANGREYPTDMIVLLKEFVSCDCQHEFIDGSWCPGRCVVEVLGKREDLCLCSYTCDKGGGFSDKVFWDLEEVETNVKREPYFPRGRMLRFE